RRAARRPPRHTLVRPLLRDLGGELVSAPVVLDDPVQVCVVDLTYLLHPLHERGELLELRPLVVRGLDGDRHLDRLLDVRHVSSPSTASAGSTRGRSRG